MIVRIPDGIEPTPYLTGVNPKDFTSHTYLVLHQVKLLTSNVIFENQEVNGRLYIEEVGVDLELCVHAHGHDVDPIMEASCNNNYFLDIISSGIGELILFAIVVLTMFSFKYHVLCKFKHLSSIEQYPSSTSSLICRRVLPPGISRLSWNCITFMSSSSTTFPLIPIFHGL